MSSSVLLSHRGTDIESCVLGVLLFLPPLIYIMLHRFVLRQHLKSTCPTGTFTRIMTIIRVEFAQSLNKKTKTAESHVGRWIKPESRIFAHSPWHYLTQIQRAALPNLSTFKLQLHWMPAGGIVCQPKVCCATTTTTISCATFCIWYVVCTMMMKWLRYFLMNDTVRGLQSSLVDAFYRSICWMLC